MRCVIDKFRLFGERGAAALIVAAFSLATPVWGLDSTRTITQAFLRKWQFPQALPQATITKIVQTTDGYLWLGTQSGLYRFDGIRFQATTPVLPKATEGSRGDPGKNLWIQDLCEDREQNLWLATDDGLIRRGAHGKEWQRWSLAEGLPSTQLRCLLYDREGQLWIGTERGLARLQEGKLTTAGAPSGLDNVSIVGLTQVPNGPVCIATGTGQLFAYQDAQFSKQVLTTVSNRATITSVLGAADSTLWVGTSSGLIRIDKTGERRFGRKDGLAHDAVECLMLARDGGVWVGTKDGISRIIGERIESFRAQDGLSQSMVHSICEDHEGGIWVGTKHGLNQFIDRRTVPLTTSEGLPSNDTGPIFQDNSGTIWVGTLGRGLARYTGPRNFETLTTQDGLPSGTIVTLADGRQNELWVGTDQGLCRLKEGKVAGSFTMAEGLPADSITSLCLDHRGVLWIGTVAGLALAEGEPIKIQTVKDFPSRSVDALVDAGKKGILIATDGSPGLYRSLEGAKGPITPVAGDYREVDAFCLDRDGDVWIGTRGNGLGLFDGSTTKMLTVKDGLYDNDIFGLATDDRNQLWMACSRGIFFVSLTDLKECVEGRLKRITGMPFSPTDGQRTIECQDNVQPAAIRTQDGRIWFSTIRGVTIADPGKLQRKLTTIPVLVEEVQVNGQEFAAQEIPPLPPGPTNLTFRYTALSYLSPTRLRFRHKLDGFDKDWVEAGSRREAFYTNLPAGKYEFRVQAAMPESDWYPAAQPVSIKLSRHFYQTGWFVFAVIAAIGLAIWIGIRLRMMRVKAHLNAVISERTRIARELHDTLLQGFSGVTMQLQALGARLQSNADKKSLEEIIRDAGSCLREARRSVGGLRSSAIGNQGFGDAITQLTTQLTETTDTRLRLRVEPNVPALPQDVMDNLLRIIQEATVNTLRHANARTLEVSLEHTPQRLDLKIADDGVGFDARHGEAAFPGHYGLIGMRERAAQIGAKLHLESAPGTGAKIHLELPLPANRSSIHSIPVSTESEERQLSKEQS